MCDELDLAAAIAKRAIANGNLSDNDRIAYGRDLAQLMLAREAIRANDLMEADLERVRPRTSVCQRCGAAWQERTWNFYTLCPSCFKAFDEQRRRGRHAAAAAAVNCPAQVYYEQPDDWLAARPVNEKISPEGQ